MTNTPHTLKARQRNDAQLAANEQKLEILEARSKGILVEITDLQAERRALMAAAVAFRDADGQL